LCKRLVNHHCCSDGTRLIIIGAEQHSLGPTSTSLELKKATLEKAFKPGSTEEQYTVTVQAPNNAAKTNVADIKTDLSPRSVNHEIRSPVGQIFLGNVANVVAKITTSETFDNFATMKQKVPWRMKARKLDIHSKLLQYF
jgi:hypothetical protein